MREMVFNTQVYASVARKAQAEGIVMLENRDRALPLEKGSKVSLVGVTSYDPVYGGTGSGTISVSDAVSFVASLYFFMKSM